MRLSNSFLIAVASALPLARAAEFLGRDTLIPDESRARPLNLTVSVNFPDSAHHHPPRLWNDFVNRVNLTIGNYETEAVTIEFIGGTLWDLAGHKQVVNLTQQRIGAQIQPQTETSFLYPIRPWLKEQDLLLNVGAILLTPGGVLAQLPAFNQTVSIVERPTGFFEPDMLFLYTLLSAAFGAAGYYAYKKYIDAAKPKRVNRDRKEVTAVKAKATSADVGKSFDQSWIPEHHIKKQPAVKRGRSGTPKGKRGKAELSE